MPAHQDANRTWLLKKLAYIHSRNLNWSNERILKVLGLPQTFKHLSVFEADAIDRGYLIKENRAGPSLPTDECDSLHREIFASEAYGGLEPRIKELSGRQVDEVLVFETSLPKKRDITEAEEWDERARLLGQRAARTVLDYVLRSKRVGCCFGRQLASLALGMRGLHKTKSKSPVVEIFPVMGDACIPAKNWDEQWTASQISASGVSEAIDAVVNGSTPRRKHTLASVPIVCPHSYRNRKNDFAEVLEFYADQQISSYRAIFGTSAIRRFQGKPNENVDEPGLAHSMDCLLTTVGGPFPAGRFWTKEFFDVIGDDAQERAEAELLGDVGGVWLPNFNERHWKKPPMPSDFKREIESLWTCLDESMVKDCCERARNDPSKVGVVALCTGRERWKVAWAAAMSGMVNKLLLDSSCAQALLLHLPKEQSDARTSKRAKGGQSDPFTGPS